MIIPERSAGCGAWSGTARAVPRPRHGGGHATGHAAERSGKVAEMAGWVWRSTDMPRVERETTLACCGPKAPRALAARRPLDVEVRRVGRRWSAGQVASDVSGREG